MKYQNLLPAKVQGCSRDAVSTAARAVKRYSAMSERGIDRILIANKTAHINLFFEFGQL